MEQRTEFFVGLDVHKDSISVAACEEGRTPARFVGVIGPDVRQLAKLLAKAGVHRMSAWSTRLGRPASGCTGNCVAVATGARCARTGRLRLGYRPPGAARQNRLIGSGPRRCDTASDGKNPQSHYDGRPQATRETRARQLPRRIHAQW